MEQGKKAQEPGRELDALVAEYVMGMRRDVIDVIIREYSEISRLMPDCVFIPRIPYYSTNITDAWEVVERMTADGWEVLNAGYSMSTRKWDFTFNNGSSFPGPLCDTAPHAICLAALAAIERNTNDR